MLVEAIEDLFVPVLVYNNTPEDEAILKSFGEPSWNNPVVRFLDSGGSDLIPRADGVWTTSPLARRMLEALRSAGRESPSWLQLVAAAGPENPASATFAMHCYWEGEAKLGAIEGVLSTRSAWIGELEVVQLVFDPAVVDYQTLVKEAQKNECASTVFAHSAEQQQQAAALVGEQHVQQLHDESSAKDAKASDQKYALSGTLYRFLPLTELQAVRINAALASGDADAAAAVTSPRQQEMLEKIAAMAAVSMMYFDNLQRPRDDRELAAYHQRLQLTLSADAPSPAD